MIHFIESPSLISWVYNKLMIVVAPYLWFAFHSFSYLRSTGVWHITFITVYCYNCSVLFLVIVVSLLLCLIYKLNFITGKHVLEYIYIPMYNGMYIHTYIRGVWYSPQFSGIHCESWNMSPVEKGERYCIFIILQ